MEYFYCKICRVNTEDKGHVYSKKHKSCVKKALDKFINKVCSLLCDHHMLKEILYVKIKDAKNHSERPEIIDIVHNQSMINSKIWCILCWKDIEINETNERFIIKFQKFIEHLNS